jgi:peptidoglycan/LPS O-acetylase OafA/YrhL
MAWISMLIMVPWLIIYSIGHNLGDYSKNYFVVLNSGIVRCSMGFFSGVLVCILFRKFRTALSFWTWELLSVLSLSAAICMLHNFQRYGLLNQGDFILVLLLFPVAIGSVANSHYCNSLLSIKPLAFLGTISYSIYLIHFPVQLLFYLLIQKTISLNFAAPSSFFIYLSCVILISTLVYYTIERPCVQFAKNRKAASRPAASSV